MTYGIFWNSYNRPQFDCLWTEKKEGGDVKAEPMEVEGEGTGEAKVKEEATEGAPSAEEKDIKEEESPQTQGTIVHNYRTI